MSLTEKFLGPIGDELGKVAIEAATILYATRRRAFAVAAAFALAGAALGLWSVLRADKYQRIVETALAKDTENTPQTFKALETLVLVSAETGANGKQIPFRKQLQDAPVHDRFRHLLREFHATLAKAAPGPRRRLVIAEPELTKGQVRRQQDAIITEEPGGDDIGFLFLPARLLHMPEPDFDGVRQHTTAIEKYLHISETGSLNACPPAQPSRTSPGASDTMELCDDVITSRRLIATMKKATDTPVTGANIAGLEIRPEQVYVITENGLNRIVSRQGHDSSFYRNQFRAATVFPARPYYVGAVALGEPAPLLEDSDPGPQGRLGDYFYISEPYLDIGGNGIVVTLARAYRYANHSDGVICFDLKLGPQGELAKKVKSFVDDLGGKWAELTCDMSSKHDPTCRRTKGDDTLGEDARRSLDKKLKAASEKLAIADVVGNFSFVREDSAADAKSDNASIVHIITDRVIHPKNELGFTIPIDPPLVTDSVEHAVQLSFVAASISIGRYLQTTAIMAASALTLFGFALTIVIGSWANEARINETEIEKKKAAIREQEDLREALANVANVMLHARTPYVRLDATDHIVDGNFALAGFFGLPESDESIETKLRRTRFEDWLADAESKREYYRVQKLRAEGKPVEPYTLTFRTSGGPKTARVASSVVPETKATNDGLPQTFGILTDPAQTTSTGFK